MERIIDIIHSINDLYSIDGAKKEDIDKAEEELQLSFSYEYILYTSTYGRIMVGAHELTGVCSSKRLGVVSVTRDEWERNPGIPHTFYVIEALNIDDIVIWQNEEGKVYQSAPNCQMIKVYDSLSDYILSL